MFLVVYMQTYSEVKKGIFQNGKQLRIYYSRGGQSWTDLTFIGKCEADCVATFAVKTTHTG